MSTQTASIRVFVTGGTFDKEYNELTGSLAFKETHLPEMLRLGRSRIDVSIRTLMMIDSLDMTAGDQSLIVEQCRQAAEMNGRCFNWDRVRKNLDTGVFEAI